MHNEFGFVIITIKLLDDRNHLVDAIDCDASADKT
jgi:hypothetical protein